MMTPNMTSVSMVSSFLSNHNSNACACRRNVLPPTPILSFDTKQHRDWRPVFSKQTARLGRLGRRCI